MTNPEEDLRDKDEIVLQAIQNGEDDIQKITETTILENHEVNYCFTKLEELNLIDIEKNTGYTTRNINGQKRVFQTPKQANLTNRAEKYLENTDREDLAEYENLGRKELVQKVHRLERRVDNLEGTIQSFRKQVQKHLLD
jgi:predicted transcriptional regulator